MSRQLPRFGGSHITINVRDLDRSVECYRKFGFEILLLAILYPSPVYLKPAAV